MKRNQIQTLSSADYENVDGVWVGAFYIAVPTDEPGMTVGESRRLGLPVDLSIPDEAFNTLVIKFEKKV
jgi:hypothetical protein